MSETIAAISTAYGEGGIGIIRISGEDAFDIMKAVFCCSKNPQKNIDSQQEKNEINRRMRYGRIVDKDQVIDEAMAVFMKGPNTYTAEDICEINCHGSMVSLRKTLALVLEKGARLAEPGEFTKRAFLNGRMDLSQAEAVIDVIKAKTDKSFDVAISQLEGSLSQRIVEIRKAILDVLVDLTVNIDYPDEDIEELTYDKLEKSISLISDMIENLLSTADTGRMIREGLRVTIVGKPNVGKSSLMNGLLRESRAIVTEIPGTTRDTIEEALSIRNIPVYLTDTAGIRNTDDKVEKIGIEKSKEAFNRSDFIIFILDGSQAMTEEDLDIMEYLKDKKALVLINKNDLGKAFDIEDVKAILPGADVLETSLINGEGISEIEDLIEALVYGGKIAQKDSIMVNNVRHVDLLKRAKKSLEDAAEMTRRKEALEFIEIDVNSAYENLGEIIGETVSDDILNEVFSRFCLGK